MFVAGGQFGRYCWTGALENLEGVLVCAYIWCFEARSAKPGGRETTAGGGGGETDSDLHRLRGLCELSAEEMLTLASLEGSAVGWWWW